MPWTVDAPPPPAKHWTTEEKAKCVAAANAVMRGSGDESQAVYACIHAAGKTKKTVSVGAFDNKAIARAFAEQAEKINELLKRAKKAKSRVDYRIGRPTASCGMCVHYDSGLCELVSGHIDPKYICDLFERAKARVGKAGESQKMELGDFVNILKRGAKHSAKDMEHIQKAHDHVSALVDGMHCVATTGDEDKDMAMAATIKANLVKRGAKHSGATMSQLKTVHDDLCKIGAKCPIPTGPGLMYNDRTYVEGEG